jgi:hypothetical protein
MEEAFAELFTKAELIFFKKKFILGLHPVKRCVNSLLMSPFREVNAAVSPTIVDSHTFVLEGEKLNNPNEKLIGVVC